MTIKTEQYPLQVSNKTLNQSNSQSSNWSPAEPSPHHRAQAMWRSQEQISLASSDSNNFEFLSISNAGTPSEKNIKHQKIKCENDMAHTIWLPAICINGHFI